MNILRNLLSGLISFFLVPLIVIFLIANSFFGILLNPEIFKGILKENDSYNRLASKVIPNLLVNLAGHSESQSGVPPQALDTIISKIDKKILAADLEKAVNSTYDFVTSDEKHFEVKIDLTPYTTPIASNLNGSIADYFNSLPACTPAQEAAIDPNTLSTIDCKPKGTDANKYLKELNTDNLLDEIKTSFPTQLIINEQQVTTYPQTNLLEGSNLPKERATKQSSVLQNLQKSIQSYHSGINFLLITILILFAVLAATRLPNLSSMLKWVSSALFSASVLPLALSSLALYFLKPDAFNKMLESSIGDQLGTNFQTAASSLLSDNLFNFSQKIFQQMQMLSFILIVIAIILYGFFFFLEQKSRKKAKNTLDATLDKTHNISS